MRALVFLSLLVSGAAVAQDEIAKCADEYSDCHDNCALRFGVSTRDDQRLKLIKCIDKCKRTDNGCRNRYFEAKNGNLDPRVLKDSKHDDDLREDDKKHDVVPAEKPMKKRETEPEKRTATRAEDLETAKKTEPAKKDEPVKKQPEAEPEKRTATRAEDLGPTKKDEPVKEAEPAPAPAADKKKDDPPKEAKKADPATDKSKKKERSLDEWDPEAL